MYGILCLMPLQEDSYVKLNSIVEVKKQLTVISMSLIKRMRLDLTAEADDDDALTLGESSENTAKSNPPTRRWIAHARTLRLSTRPRPPRNPDGSRPRLFNRTSKSDELPFFVYSFRSSVDVLAEKLVNETLLPLFRQLHPEKDGWDLSLVNVCVTNMAPLAAETKDSAGRDISRMFRRQESVLREWKVEDLDAPPPHNHIEGTFSEVDTHPLEDQAVGARDGSEDMHVATQDSSTAEDEWGNEDESTGHSCSCQDCGAVMPSFAMVAHQRFVSSVFHLGRFISKVLLFAFVIVPW